ncbi:MAG TPA: hypothetical protein VGP90_01535, partial [Acidimicrobiia bacterium]|nr:hypothetical protein [Acidimicrobiia bacterium]
VGRDRLPRTRAARSPAPAVHEPDPAQLPDWSAETLEKLDALAPLQQAMVQWRAAGCSATEAYRKATGRDAPSSKQSAHQVFSRPEVAAALAAALHDRNFDALCDRGWMILKLKRIIDECSEMRTPAAGNTLITALVTMAKLQGEWPMGRSGRCAPRPSPPQPTPNPEVTKRIDDMIAEANRLISAPRTTAGSPPVTPAAADTPASEPADPPRPVEPADEDEPVVTTPPPPADGLPIGVVRPLAAVIWLPRPEAAQAKADDPAQAGPVLPRGNDGPVRYRGASPYFMGAWA